MKKTHTIWDVKYAMLCQRIQDEVPMSKWTIEEKELFAYCVKEGFFDVTVSESEDEEE